MNLANFSPDDLRQLKTQLDAMTSTDGRTSEFRPRQLHNLSLPPTKDDARPLFIWSAEAPRNVPVSGGKAYPALVWHYETGEERTITSAEEREALGSQWLSTQPTFAAPDPMEAIQAALEQLSPEDRAMVMQSQLKARTDKLTEQLAQLSPEKLAELLEGGVPVAKRGPGRPKKVA